MKIIIAFIFFLSGSFCASAQQAGPTLTGMVKDSADGKPLAGVSIFLNSTSKGTISLEDGSFRLRGIPRGKYDLVVTAVGYETFVTDINGSQPPPDMTIVLRRKASELAAVTVEPNEKDGWNKYGKYFLDNFIGTIDNARGCNIKNRSVLRFHFSKKANRLTVTAAEPLIIENKALGYILEFKLEAFVSDYNSHIITFLGYPFFREMSTTNQGRRRRWEEHRQLAFKGSILHFMRSLYTSRTRDEGFVLEQRQKIENTRRTIIIPADSLVTVYADGTKSLFFIGQVSVIYREGQKGVFRLSQLQLVTPAKVSFEENGSYYPPQEFLTSGSWGETEKIANLLPLDYGQR